MITRIWRTRFDPARLAELRHFADTVSAPMFAALPGCVGHLYADDGATWITQTFWESEPHIAEAEATPQYRQTVERIVAAGFLEGEQTTEVFTVTRICLPAPGAEPG